MPFKDLDRSIKMEYRQLKEKQRLGEMFAEYSLTEREKSRLAEIEELMRGSTKRTQQAPALLKGKKLAFSFVVVLIVVALFIGGSYSVSNNWAVVYINGVRYPVDVIPVFVSPGDSGTVSIDLEIYGIVSHVVNGLDVAVDGVFVSDDSQMKGKFGLSVSQNGDLLHFLAVPIDAGKCSFKFGVEVAPENGEGVYRGGISMTKGLLKKTIPIEIHVESDKGDNQRIIQQYEKAASINEFIRTNADPNTYDVAIYVSTEGNDAWSGRLKAPNSDRTDGPFASISRAMEEVRLVKESEGFKGTITVFLREGIYYLEEPLLFTHKDGGSISDPQISIIYSAYENEKVVLSGGKPIDGWEIVEVNGMTMWRTYLPEVEKGDWYFTQLFVNGSRRLRPRLPKEDYYKIANVPNFQPPPAGEVPPPERHDMFKFAKDEFDASWSNLEDVEVVVLHTFTESRLPVRKVYENDKLVEFAKYSTFSLWDRHGGEFCPYYIENVFEALDTPGEWYLNRSTGMLYYYPKPGEDIHNTEVIAPRLSQLIRFEVDPYDPQESWIENLHLTGLMFSHTEWKMIEDRAAFVQAAAGVPGAIFWTGTRFCSLRNCTIANIGTYGFELGVGTGPGFTGDAFSVGVYAFGSEDSKKALRGQIVSAGENNLIERNVFYDLGAGGIKIHQDTVGTTIQYNTIRDGGHVFPSAVGIFVGDSGENLITDNHIYDLNYTGISVGWTWGYGFSQTRNNIIERNHIHHVGRKMFGDMGGIYTLGVSPGTVIRYNHIHDVHARNFGGWGIYLDEGSSNILVEKNLVYRTTSGGFHIHYGRNNVIQNNIFAFGMERQISGGIIEEGDKFTFRRNIIYFSENPVFALYVGPWDSQSVEIDYNLYHKVSSGSVQFLQGAGNAKWQEREKDKHSLVADPKFVDPENDDYTLHPDSPAFILGFESFDVPDFCAEEACM